MHRHGDRRPGSRPWPVRLGRGPVAVAGLVGLLAVGACGGGEPPTASTTGTEPPTEQTDTDGTVVPAGTAPGTTAAGATDDATSTTTPPTTADGSSTTRGPGAPGRPGTPGAPDGSSEATVPAETGSPEGPPAPGIPAPTAPAPAAVAPRRVLLFTRTEGFHHDSVAVAAPALTAALSARGFGVETTDDPAVFGADRLAGLDAVVFLETTGDVLDPPQEAALQQFVEGGGGWAGVHSALDTEYEWPFYATLAGAHFRSHPAVQTATVRREDADHPAMAGVPATWVRSDEWYDLRANPRAGVHVLATVDETTYADGQMGADHPIAWCRTIGAGQSFVTAMGHTDASWSDPTFVGHVAAGVVSVTEPGHCR